MDWQALSNFFHKKLVTKSTEGRDEKGDRFQERPVVGSSANLLYYYGVPPWNRKCRYTMLISHLRATTDQGSPAFRVGDVTHEFWLWYSLEDARRTFLCRLQFDAGYQEEQWAGTLALRANMYVESPIAANVEIRRIYRTIDDRAKTVGRFAASCLIQKRNRVTGNELSPYRDETTDGDWTRIIDSGLANSGTVPGSRRSLLKDGYVIGKIIDKQPLLFGVMA